MQTIEGVTPSMLWTALIVAVGLCALIVLFGNTLKAVAGIREAKRKPNEEAQRRLAEEVSTRIRGEIDGKLDTISAKLASINAMLAKDKDRLDNHERQLSNLESSISANKEGFSVLCTALIAILNHELHNGNQEEIIEASKALTEYLTRRN